MVTNCNNNSFSEPCVSGYLHLIQWTSHSVNFSFSEPCVSGYLHLIQWTSHSVNFSFSELCVSGYLHLIQWTSHSVNFSFSELCVSGYLHLQHDPVQAPDDGRLHLPVVGPGPGLDHRPHLCRLHPARHGARRLHSQGVQHDQGTQGSR